MLIPSGLFYKVATHVGLASSSSRPHQRRSLRSNDWLFEFVWVCHLLHRLPHNSLLTHNLYMDRKVQLTPSNELKRWHVSWMPTSSMTTSSSLKQSKRSMRLTASYVILWLIYILYIITSHFIYLQRQIYKLSGKVTHPHASFISTCACIAWFIGHLSLECSCRMLPFYAKLSSENFHFL